MKKLYLITRLFLSALIVFTVLSCDDDKENISKGKYDDGVFVVSEGKFGASNGTLGWFDPSKAEAVNNILKATGLSFAGDVVQSLTIADGKGYLVVNGDNTVIVFDIKTLETEEIITDSELINPRYVEVVDDKVYISCWGRFDEDFLLVDSYVLVYDPLTHTVKKKIDTDEGTENLLYTGPLLFASNANFGYSNTVTAVNPSANSVLTNIEVGAGPSGMVTDALGNIWVITTGTFSGNDGKLVKINWATLTVEKEIDLGVNPGGDLAISEDKQTLYYYAGNSIFSLSVDATEVNEPFIVNNDVVSGYAMNVDPLNGDIYFGDAGDFASPGVAYVYDHDGSLKHSFQTGIAPTQFVFHKK